MKHLPSKANVMYDIEKMADCLMDLLERVEQLEKKPKEDLKFIESPE